MQQDSAMRPRARNRGNLGLHRRMAKFLSCLFTYLLLFFSLVWSQQMQQDTALQLAPGKSSFWSLDFEEPKGLMVDSRLQNTPMLVSSTILCYSYWPNRVHLRFDFNTEFCRNATVVCFFNKIYTRKILTLIFKKIFFSNVLPNIVFGKI